VHVGWLKLGIYHSDGKGGLTPEQLLDCTYVNWGAHRMSVGDLNGDGKRDIAIVDGQITIFYQR
jgi:FG-GAP repeat protein